jgi:hypothetical protein
VKHQKTAVRKRPVTRTVEPSTEKRCGKPVRVNTDVDESEDWHCVKDAGHQDDHYVENDDGSSGMAIKLTELEREYWNGYNAAAQLAQNDLTVWAMRVLWEWARRHEEATPPTPIFHHYLSRADGDSIPRWKIANPVTYKIETFASPEAAVVFAANALVTQDPSLAPSEKPAVQP